MLYLYIYIYYLYVLPLVNNEHAIHCGHCVYGFRMLYPQNGSFTTVAVFAVAALDALTRKTWILALQAQELREEVQLELKVAWKGREKPWFSSHSCRKTNENIIEYLYIACVHSLWTWFCRKPYRFNIYAVVF